MEWARLVYDFLAGGALIATMLAIAQTFGPYLAGIVAAMPVRLGTTLFLSGAAEGPGLVLEMLRGSVPGSVGAFGLMLVLSKTVKRLGIWKSFALGCLACAAIIAAGVWIL